MSAGSLRDAPLLVLIACAVHGTGRGGLLSGAAFFGSCEEFPNDETTPRYREALWVAPGGDLGRDRGVRAKAVTLGRGAPHAADVVTRTVARAAL